jgi:hypothetical protein
LLAGKVGCRKFLGADRLPTWEFGADFGPQAQALSEARRGGSGNVMAATPDEFAVKAPTGAGTSV